MIRVIFFLCLMSCLYGCTTTKSTTNDEDKKIATAKINTQLGIAYLDRKNIQRAKQKLLLALQEAPNIPETWYTMAYFLEATGDKVQAKQYYLNAIAIAPSRGDSHNNFGTFLCRSGDYQGAVQQFLIAVKDNQYLETADAYENAGLCSLRIPNSKMAIEYFNLALMQDPHRPASLIELAKLYYSEKNYSKADDSVTEYLKISPTNDQVLALQKKIEDKMEHKLIQTAHVNSLPLNEGALSGT